MDIKILGTRGEIDTAANRHRYHSGVLIDRMLLFDLGEPVFLCMNPAAIFITHLHPDHAFFVTRAASIHQPVYAPEPFTDSASVEVINAPFRTGPYTIIPIPTCHSKLVRSNAYLIRKGQESVLYTGDMIGIDEKYHHLFQPVDLVIAEGSYIRKGGLVRRDRESGSLSGHAGIPDLLGLFSPFTDNVLFVHFGSWFYKNIPKARRKLKHLGREYQVTVHVGYDGMDLDTATLVNSPRRHVSGKP
jgi:ribonuclease BN (tRNA processing enzyme)